MARYFSAKRIAELNAGRDEVKRQFRDLRDRLHTRTYKTNRGAEFAKHGLCRRLDTLVRVIDQVFNLLPPEQDEIPLRDKVLDASMAIHAFVMNAFGSIFGTHLPTAYRYTFPHTRSRRKTSRSTINSTRRNGKSLQKAIRRSTKSWKRSN
jgi:hypothetical protein